jgi:hypothetical protein
MIADMLILYRRFASMKAEKRHLPLPEIYFTATI